MTLKRKPTLTRPLAATGFVVLLSLTTMGAQAPNALPGPEAFDWQKALTQGGLTIALLAVGWSYRKSMETWADQRVAYERRLAEQSTGFQQAKVDDALRYDRRLEEMLRATNGALQATSEAISHHTTAMVLNTETQKVLTQTVRMLDERFERMEHRSRRDD